jgi:hypothetical protein
MKRIVTGLALTATAIVAAASLASPAQAGLPGYVRQGLYGWGDQCLGIGYYGQSNHSWTYYYCNTVVPSSWDGPGSYELWVA